MSSQTDRSNFFGRGQTGTGGNSFVPTGSLQREAARRLPMQQIQPGNNQNTRYQPPVQNNRMIGPPQRLGGGPGTGGNGFANPNWNPGPIKVQPGSQFKPTPTAQSAKPAGPQTLGARMQKAGYNLAQWQGMSVKDRQAAMAKEYGKAMPGGVKPSPRPKVAPNPQMNAQGAAKAGLSGRVGGGSMGVKRQAY